MARRPHSFTEEDFESLEGRASKTEQKKAVQRMASLGSQLGRVEHLNKFKTYLLKSV